MDGSDDIGFGVFFRGLPEKSSTTFRVFDRNDYYTAHGEDAIFAAKEIFKTTSVVKYFGSGENKFASVNISKKNFESFVRDLLLVRQYRVELYRNSGSGKCVNKWNLELKGSPGNVIQFEELLFSNCDINVLTGLMSIRLDFVNQHLVVGVGYVNVADVQFFVSEFPDNDQFSNLEAMIVQLCPKECLLSTGDRTKDLNGVKRVLERSKVLVTEKPRSDFMTKTMVQDLNRLLKFKKGQQPNSAALQQMDRAVAMSSLAALIKYLELLNDEGYFGQFKLNTFDSKQYVRLDAAAADALNLMPSPNDGSRVQSVYGILNKCRTSLGQRLLARWIKQPLTDKSIIEERLDIVEALVENSDLRRILHEDHLCKIPDMQKLAKRFQRKKGTLQDCYRIYLAVEKIPILVKVLSNSCERLQHVINEKFINPLNELVDSFAKFQELVETSIDIEQIKNDEFYIKSDLDDDLAELREKLNQIEEKMDRHLEKVADDLGLAAKTVLKLESNNQLGFFFRVTKKEEKAVRNNKQYTIIDAHKSGARFRSAALQDLNVKYLVAKDSYNDKQKALVIEVVNIAAGYNEAILMVGDVLAELDVLVSFALAAVSSITYVRPTILEKGSGVLNLKNARHPCLEGKIGSPFIPNDTSFERGRNTFHIITGPNMGGKSTHIRAVGVVVMMAQIGSFVPCDSATISIVDAVLARVGAGDNQLKGVSTFMNEMLETATILRSATENSLIIIDELGRGTSTYDGFGLAWAISKYIATKIEAFCLFATHFHELTALADEIPTVRNLHVTALPTENNLTFLYRIKPGVSDRSFGIHVAEMVHFPKNVIEYAKVKALELEDFPSSAFEGTELEGTDEPVAKKRLVVKQSGEALISEFLQNVEQIRKKTASEQKAEVLIGKLKMDLAAKNNLYVNFLMNSAK